MNSKAQKKPTAAKKKVATGATKVIGSTPSAPATVPAVATKAPDSPVPPVTPDPVPPAPVRSEAVMEAATETTAAPANVGLNLSAKQRSTQMIVYLFGDGRPGSVRVSKTAFVNKQPPTTLTLVTDAYAGPYVKRAEETKEERKARLAALPKPTAAQKLAKLEEKIAKLRAKVASGESVGEPAGEPVGAGV